METYQIVILGLFFGLVVLEIIFTNFFSKHNQRAKDGVVELFGFFQLNFLLTFNPVNILFGVLSGYGFAWIGHFFIEKNKPATFTHPILSLISDYVMFWEIIRGKHKIF